MKHNMSSLIFLLLFIATFSYDLYSVGYNGYGSLGIGNFNNQNQTQLSFLDVEKVYNGKYHSFIQVQNGSFYSFGLNQVILVY